jgi:hypothetical protein
MRARTLAAAAALLFAATACSTDQTPPGTNQSLSTTAAARAPRPQAGGNTQAVSGALADGGTFVGTMTITSFSYVNNQLIANGVVSGTATTIDGTVTTITNQAFSAPATLAGTSSATAIAATGVTTQAVNSNGGGCDVLFLDLGPLSLDLLGLTVDLNEVVLDINAVPGPGALLGNLLCAVLHLLDGPGALAAILNLLAQINQILAGL